MKKFLSISAIIILFIISFIIFWAGLSPETFVSFVQKYPAINKTAVQYGVITPQISFLNYATSSETIISKNGLVIIGNNSWSVEIAKTSDARTNGLSNRMKLYNNEGMLFAFNSMFNQSFWMKDMLFPIDIIFFDSNWKIVLIESNLQPDSYPKTFGNNVLSQYVLEINANEAVSYGLKVGDQAIFLNK